MGWEIGRAAEAVLLQLQQQYAGRRSSDGRRPGPAEASFPSSSQVDPALPGCFVLLCSMHVYTPQRRGGAERRR